MAKDKPTLRINFVGPRDPRCSVCGRGFGSEGFAQDLMDAFALHVRREHMYANSKLMMIQHLDHARATTLRSEYRRSDAASSKAPARR